LTDTDKKNSPARSENTPPGAFGALERLQLRHLALSSVRDRKKVAEPP